MSMCLCVCVCACARACVCARVRVCVWFLFGWSSLNLIFVIHFYPIIFHFVYIMSHCTEYQISDTGVNIPSVFHISLILSSPHNLLPLPESYLLMIQALLLQIAMRLNLSSKLTRYLMK